MFWQKRVLSFQVFLAIDPVIDDVTTWRCGPNELAWAVAMEKYMGAPHEDRIRLIKNYIFCKPCVFSISSNREDFLYRLSATKQV